MKEKGQSLVVVAITLAFVISLVAMYMSNAGQNRQLANNIADSFTSVNVVVTDIISEHTDLVADIDIVSRHADYKHGADAEAARKCSNDPFALKFYNPALKRTAYVCNWDGKRSGIRIIDELGQEITAFLKKIRDNEHLMEYMSRAGYGLVR